MPHTLQQHETKGKQISTTKNQGGTTMKRKPKMHNEDEFNQDNIYQEDDRQVDLREDLMGE